MSSATILIIDDEEGIRDTLQGILEDEGYSVLTASSAEEGLDLLQKSGPDLVILDIWLPNMDGIEALSRIREASSELPVIMISGHANVDLAVKATKLGAYDFLEKPLSLDRIILTLERALDKTFLLRKYRELKKDVEKKVVLIGNSSALKYIREQIQLAAKSNARVLLTGESGVGKEVIARLLHAESDRADRPFVEMNCAAIPQELIESELFGHEKGSFTGAFEAKKGKFELAHQGTLFLDEIGDMSLATQAKVLRVLETQTFQKVGGNKNIQVDVRIIAATNKNLVEEIKKEKFREDLYFRLNVITIDIPPLRERKDDIPELADHFLEMFAADYRRQKKSITDRALKKLQFYEWPGNVRELRNFIEKMVIMVADDAIDEKHVEFPAEESELFRYSKLKDARDSFEKQFIEKKLRENNWNVSKTAEVLDVERSNLHRKIKTYGINMP